METKECLKKLVKKNYKFVILLLVVIINSVIIDSDVMKLLVQLRKLDKVENQVDTVYLNTPIETFVTLTVYNPVESQCDDTPLVTANGTKIDLEKLKKGEIKYCAVSRNLLKEFPYGSIIYIEGHGEYKVVDTMNKRFTNYVDILQDVSQKGFKEQNVKIIKIK